MTKILLSILFFTLPFIHAKLFPTLGIDYFFEVSGNFEFTKTIYFNIFSSFIFLSFFIEKITPSVFVPQTSPSMMETKKSSLSWRGMSLATGGVLSILFFSTIFSISPFGSLIGDTEKGHTALMFLNLLGLFIILKNQKKDFLKKLILISLLAGVGVSLLAVKELFFETYNYGELSSRALGSFGHPNYLAGYLLLLLPLICSPFPLKRERIQERVFFGGIVFLFLVTILLTKSIWALVLIIGYLLYLISPYIPASVKNKVGYGIVSAMILLSVIVSIQFFPEKLHSFLSRFYIWETTLKIILSDIKIFFIGGGAETLPYFFDSFKSPEVYIYENYGYTADRPHNFLLNIFYHFGIIGVSIFIYFLYTFFIPLFQREYPKGEGFFISIILFLLFGIFHFFSISSYLVLILIINIMIVPSQFSPSGRDEAAAPFSPWRKGFRIGGCIGVLLVSLTGAYYSLEFYRSEIFYKNKNYSLAQENFAHPKYLIELGEYNKAEKLAGTISQKNLREQIIMQENREKICTSLMKLYPSVENYFYCGKILKGFGNDTLAKQYYINGLDNLPDLWNGDSPYWNNYFIKHTVTGNRFFSEKFSDISEILEKVEK